MNAKLARLLVKQGKTLEAEQIYKELAKQDTNKHQIYREWAQFCVLQGRIGDSIKLLRKALKIKPDYEAGHNDLGLSLYQKGDLTSAINSYRTAIQLKPDYTNAYINLGNALKKQGDFPTALDTYRKAIEFRPSCVEAHYNLGVTLQEQGKLAEAISSYQKAVQLKPKFFQAYNNIGLIFKEQGDLAEAINSYRKAIELNANYPEAHFNLGIALKEQGNLTAALSSYKTALQLKPNYPEADWNVSLAMLLGGDYKNGWELYELRTKQKWIKHNLHAQPKCKQWHGEHNCEQSGDLLLVSEQGLGDTLQFMRYAITLKEKGKSISLCAQPKLHSLIQASGIDSSPLTPDQANQFTKGQWIPLLSIPRYLKVCPSDPIITDPYIKTTNTLDEKWSKILATEKKPIVGINWQGNPNTEKTGLAGRSLALKAFALIAKNSQISLLSLQKGFGSEQLDTCSFKKRFVGCQDHISKTWDFLETAAIIANCDLIITSDTSIAHLAGGMGKPTWLLLHKVPDWRWGLTGHTSFWYPSMRLFRQQKRGNWKEVIEEVARSLQKHF